MKYSEKQDAVANLRACADWLESNPRAIELPGFRLEASVYVHEYAKDADGNTDYSQVDEFAVRLKMRRIAKALGSCIKDYSGDSFSLIKLFGESKWSDGSVVIRFRSQRNAICRKVVKEVKEIPAREEVIKYEARTEEVVEWVCDDALLAPTA